MIGTNAYSLEREERRLCAKYGVTDIEKVLYIQAKILKEHTTGTNNP